MGFVVFLGVQRRMQEVIHKESQLLFKGAANGDRCILQGLNGTFGRDNLHRLVVLDLPVFRVRIAVRRNLMAASAVSKGP